MMAFAINNDHEKVSIAYLILEKNNLDRMATGDPVTMPPWDLSNILSTVKYPQNIGIVICYEPDSALLRALVETDSLLGLLDHLTRNMEIKLNDNKPIVSMQMSRTGRTYQA